MYTIVTAQPQEDCRFIVRINRVDNLEGFEKLDPELGTLCFVIEGAPKLLNMEVWEDTWQLEFTAEKGEIEFYPVEPSEPPVRIEVVNDE